MQDTDDRPSRAGRLRRRWPLRVVVILAAAASVVAAAPIEQPAPMASTPRQVISLTVQASGRATPPFLAPILPAGPDVVVYADGAVIALDPAAPAVAPQVWPYRIGRLTEAQVDALLTEATSARLLEAPAPYPPGASVPPSARTILVLSAGDESFTHVADGLGRGGSDPRRAQLHAFVQRLREAAARAATSPYEATRLALVAAPAPATRTATTVPWPDGNPTLATSATCTVVSDRDVIALLQRQIGGTLYTEAGRAYTLATRVLLPGANC